MLLDENNHQRLYEPSLINDNLLIKEYFLKDELLNITFSDGEIGNFLIEDIINEISNFDVIPNKIEWYCDTIKLQYHDFSNFDNSKELTIKMLNDFHRVGFVIIKNLSKKKGTVINFAESLGPIRATNFGKHFDVMNKSNPNDLAYTSLGLSSHTDNPYRKPIPGIQLLHCVVNDAQGGNSTLVDGYAISNYLKKNEKNYFDILTSTDVLFYFKDKDINLKNWGRLIELDDKENFKQIKFSGRLDYVSLLSPKNLKLFYKARKKLYELCNSDDFLINFKLKSGMLVMFDNHRLLHGRTKFNLNSGNRHLQGCYIEHDVVEGRLRNLISH